MSTLLERAYWKNPTQVLTGLTWLVAGIVLGVMFCKALS